MIHNYHCGLFMKQSLRLYIIAVIAVVTVVVAAYLMLRPAIKETGVDAVPQNEVVISTHAVLDSIRSIGEWELMSIDVQADVDTVRKSMLGLVKHKLQRRYFGRLSVGIDMQQASLQDTVLVLPHAALLDDNFIDESRTELIVCESQSMEQEPRLKAAMLAKAKAMMMRDGIKPQTISDCEQRAREEVMQQLKLLRQDNINVIFK